jgi:LDH2 family malate/lactate/ureidoglycolate dehydrogenase
MKFYISRSNAGTGEAEGDRYEWRSLHVFGCEVFQRAGVPPDDAREVMDCLLSADLRGADSHGVVRLPIHFQRLKAGLVNPRPSMQLRASIGAASLLNGDNGLGPVVGNRAMQAAIKLAGNSGIGFIGVYGSNHFGAAGYYVRKAIAENMIGVVASNSVPNMAPYGGRDRLLGTNPFAVGIPTGKEPPLVFDSSSSVVARGKIIVAAKLGTPIPDDWALDEAGNPTTDAAAALKGTVLPFAGAKGSGIALIIDIFCGVLTGAAFASHLNSLTNFANLQNLGHVFVALRTDIFISSQEFAARMDEILRLLKSGAPALGFNQVQAPGEGAAEREARNLRLGIPLAPKVVEELSALGSECGVAFPSRTVSRSAAAQEWRG